MKIEWDDAPPEVGGGFTVTEGELKNPPKGWVEDEPGHWQPQWPPCRYRRLSMFSMFGTAQIIPFCLLPDMKKNVTHDICAACTLHKPPASFVRLTDELKKEIEEELEETSQGVVIPLEDYSPPEEYIEYPVDDVVFGVSHPLSDWKPCKHRARSDSKDCGGCSKLICTSEACPLNGKTILKKNCRDCEFREEP